MTLGKNRRNETRQTAQAFVSEHMEKSKMLTNSVVSEVARGRDRQYYPVLYPTIACGKPPTRGVAAKEKGTH